MRLRVIDTQMPELIDRFLNLIRVAESPLGEHHVLTPMINEYSEWMEKQDFHSLPPNVLQLATTACGVIEFRSDWESNPRTKNWLISRIRHEDQAKGILFEFRAAVHYVGLHRRVNWLASVDGEARPDIRVETYSGAIVYTECTRKAERSQRTTDLGQFREDIFKTLHSKMVQRKGFDSPLHLVIYIPEEYKWAHDEFACGLGGKFEERFENKQYDVISGVTIISNELPSLRRDSFGAVYYDSDLPAFYCVNRNARFPFPSDFRHAIPGSDQ